MVRRSLAILFLGVGLLLVTLAMPLSWGKGAEGSRSRPVEVYQEYVEIPMSQWLLLGRLPRNFYRDFLEEQGGEANITPSAGQKFVYDDKEYEWKEYTAIEFPLWEEFLPGKKVFIHLQEALPGGGAIAYAYSTIESDEEKRVAVVIGSAHGYRMWLNGKEIMDNRIYRKIKPAYDVVSARLKKGTNRFLLKVERGSNWSFFFQLYEVKGDLFVNKMRDRTIVPDLRVGEATEGWVSVPVTNMSPERIEEITVAIKENDLFAPSQAVARNIEPRETRRIPIYLSARRKVRAEEESQIEIEVRTSKERHPYTVEPRIRKPDEFFVRTFRSRADGSVQPLSLIVPSTYDGSKPFPLIITLHGAHMSEWGQNISIYKPRDWYIMAAPLGRGNTRYTEIGHEDFFEVWDIVHQLYNIDENRTYLTGHSMGGYGTWYLGLRYPHLFAAIAPLAGYVDFNPSSPEFNRVIEQEISSFYIAENANNLPVFAATGAEDRVVNPAHSRRMAARLRDLGYTVELEDVPGRGHTWNWEGSRPGWGADFVHRPSIFNFLQRYTRNPYPKKVIYKTTTLRYNRAYWVTIDEMEEIYRTARIQAEVVGENRIHVEMKNIAQYTLSLNENLVKPNLPVTIDTNGKWNFRGLLPPDGKVTLRFEQEAESQKVIPYLVKETRENFEVLERLDPDEGQVVETIRREIPTGRLRKTPELFGPLADALRSKFLLVYGTRGGPEEVEISRRAALQELIRWQDYYANAIVKQDMEVTAADIAQYNLFLFGNAKTNSIMARINSKLPIRFEGDGVVMGTRRFTGPDVGLKMIYPNPLNPLKYVVVNGGVTGEALKNVHRVESHLGRYKSPDFVIYDRTLVERGSIWGPLVAGFFDKYWQLANPGRWVLAEERKEY